MDNGIMPKLVYLDPPTYSKYGHYRSYLRTASKHSCTYCTISESESPGATFNIDHFRPQEKFPLLNTKCENLRYACPRCNSYKRNNWIEESQGCIRSCEVCTNKVCDKNIPRFIDSLVEEPDEHLFLDGNDLLQVKGGSKPAEYTIKFLRLNRAQLVKLRHVRRFMDSWLNELKSEKEKAEDRLRELTQRKIELALVMEKQNSSDSEVYCKMLETLHEIMLTHVQQNIIFIDEEISRLERLMQFRCGSDE